MQVAAFVGCKCAGIEIDKKKYFAAELLIKSFQDILIELKSNIIISDLITLKFGNFADDKIVQVELITNSSILYICNYGQWFEAFNAKLINIIKEMQSNSQVLALSPLGKVDFLKSESYPCNSACSTWFRQLTYRYVKL